MKTSPTTKLTLIATLAAMALPTLVTAATFSAGHGDVIGIGYEAEAFDLHFHHDADAVIDGAVAGVEGEFAPNEIVTLVPFAGYQFIATNGGRPAGTEWDPVGVAVGQPFWFLPENEIGPDGADTLGVPYAGVGAEELIPDDWSGPLTVSLLSVVSSPIGGQFSLWSNDVGGPLFHISTADGISGADSFSIGAGDHRHFNWGFTAPGTYQLEFGVSGIHATDGEVFDSAVYTFQVIPEPSSAAMLLLGAATALRRKR